MTSTLVFWLVFAAASLIMLGISRLALYSLKPGARPILRIVLAHLIAVALAAAIGGFDMPFLAGWTRWGYALALAGFGTLPWLAVDLGRAWLKSGEGAPRRHPLRLARLATSPIKGEEKRSDSPSP